MKDMKLIMENWRYQTGKTSFNVLCERFDKGWISDELLTEDLMSVLKQGWEKGKELAGKAKEAYEAAVKKVSDFFYHTLLFQAAELIRKIKESLAPIVRTLEAIYNRVQKFCSVHPLICRIIKWTLIILAVAAVVYFVRHTLQQIQAPDLRICEGCLTTGPDGKVYEMSDTGIEAMKGYIGRYAEGSADQSPEFQQTLADAYNFVDQCANATDNVQLAEAGGQAGHILNKVSEIVVRAAEEDPMLFREHVRFAEKIVVTTVDVSKEIYSQSRGIHDVTRISYEQLRVIK
jgi:hypothetical protein